MDIHKCMVVTRFTDTARCITEHYRHHSAHTGVLISP